MQHYKNVKIALPAGYHHNQQAFAELISQHRLVFENTVMSSYAYDMRYTYLADTLRVTEVGADSFSFNVDLRYFEGCCGKDERVTVGMRAEFSLMKQQIIFTLDETVWNTDN